MKLAVKPTTVTSDKNWRARRAVKVTPKAPSCGDRKRIFKGIPASKSVMSERFGRVRPDTVRVGRRGRGNGINAGGVEDEMVNDCEVPHRVPNVTKPKKSECWVPKSQSIILRYEARVEKQIDCYLLTSLKGNCEDDRRSRVSESRR